jgi:2-hydroxy-6-oxonona-2,4-dienedioate hydrolase
MEGMMLRILRWAAIGLILAMIVVSAAYIWDMNRSCERISGKSTVIPSPYGDIEFSEGGSGPDVLVIHGSGGGYDQGELLAQATVGDQFHWIAPSRFGYLRSTFHEGATFDDQARAYAYLLDRLGIKKVAVVALSHGGPSALLFAVLYPQRVSSLTLVSCGVASSNETVQLDANQKGDTLTAIYRYDPLYWAVTNIFRSQFLQLLGASDSVIAGLNPEQKDLVDRVVDYMNPVSLRSAGVFFDNRAKMPNERIASIKAPTLIFHATDDALQLYRNAQFAAATIPGSRLVSFQRGGHLLLAVEEPTIKNQTEKHILDHING